MDKRQFQKVLKECLYKYGFEQKHNTYYLYSDECIALVETQKSYYSESYYINYGFVIRALHNEEDHLSINKFADVQGRFSYCSENGIQVSYDLSEIETDKLAENIDEEIKRILLPVVQEGIEKYFVKFPKAKCTVTRRLSEYLRWED